MIKTSARLLALLGLLQSGRTWTAPQLAARLAVQPRTVRRDVERLRELGYPVEAERGVFGGYRLGRGGSLPPLLLDADEALAVAVGLRSAAVASVAGADEAASRALGKLDKVLPPILRARMAAMDAGLVTLPTGTSPVSSDDITMILQACDTSRRLRFCYRSSEGDTTERDTEPHRLVQGGRRWYLVAWDLDRLEWRTFRLDRMSRLHLSTFPFTPREPGQDAASLVSRSVSTAPYRFQARVLVRADPQKLTELVPPTVGVVIGIGPDECLLLTGSDSLTSIALHLASLGCEMRILDPPELITRFADLGGRLLMIYEISRPH